MTDQVTGSLQQTDLGRGTKILLLVSLLTALGLVAFLTIQGIATHSGTVGDDLRRGALFTWIQRQGE